MAHKYFKNRPIALVAQDFQIRQKFPSFVSKKLKETYCWVGTLQPTPLSSTYTVEIDYTLGYLPKVYVLSPPLRSYDEKIKIPHIYENDGPRPCLFLPGNKEWTGNKLIADTIIPWLSLWLFYYEIWLSTGEWFGEGHSSASGKKED